MTTDQKEPAKDSSPPEDEERYSPGYGKELIASYQDRSVLKEAAFFVPFLRPGMTLLDCGCGPGTITVGLSHSVAPGQVTAIDLEPGQIETAQKHALEKGANNVRFQANTIYDLPFPDQSFDGAFAHAVLQHLKDPIRALKEIHRVLKPGGVMGVRDDDLGSLILAPQNDTMAQLLGFLEKVVRHSGGNPRVGRKHREILRKAGFKSVQASASCEYDGNLETTTRRGDLAASLVEHMSQTAQEAGWASADELDALAAAAREWGRHPDAFDVITWCEAVGFKE